MQKNGSSNQLGHNDLCSHAISNVDIDDISSTLNFFFNSSSREDLFTNFLVSPFTRCKNFKSVEFNLGSTCVKHTSSHFTIKSHKESLCPTFLFLPLVIIATPSPDIVTIGAFYAPLLSFDAVKGLSRGRKVPQNAPFVCTHKRFEKKTHPPRNAREKRPKRQSLCSPLRFPWVSAPKRAQSVLFSFVNLLLGPFCSGFYP
jgi:hypothetical protein